MKASNRAGLGDLPIERLIDDETPLADGVEAMRRAAEHGILKVLLDCRKAT